MKIIKELDPNIFLEYEQVLSHIESFKSREWDEFGQNDDEKKFKNKIHKQLTKDLNVFPYSMLQYDGTKPLPFKFYRVREANSVSQPSLRTEYGYAPIYFTKTQRANFYGKPVFYGASDPVTAIMEVIRNYENFKLNKGSEYYLSIWRLKDSRKINISPFLSIEYNNPFVDLVKIRNQQLDAIYRRNGLSESKIKGIKTLFEFYAKMFLNDKSYGISSYIADAHLYNETMNKSDMILYSSNVTDQRTLNFAIHPNFVDERLFLKGVIKINVVDLKYENEKIKSIKLEYSSFAWMENSNLNWKNNIESSSELHEIFPELTSHLK